MTSRGSSVALRGRPVIVREQRQAAADILAKLGVHSQLQALPFALRYGLVDAP